MFNFIITFFFLFIKGLNDCIRKISKKDGVVGLYRGFTASVVGVFIYRGLYYGLYDSGKFFIFGEKEAPIY